MLAINRPHRVPASFGNVSLLTCALALSGCGNGKESTARVDVLTRSQLIARADRICADAAAQSEALEDKNIKKRAIAASFSDQTHHGSGDTNDQSRGRAMEEIKIATRRAQRLAALEPPVQLREAYQAFVDASQESADVASRLGPGTSEQEFVRLFEQTVESAQRQGDLAERIGFQRCAQPPAPEEIGHDDPTVPRDEPAKSAPKRLSPANRRLSRYLDAVRKAADAYASQAAQLGTVARNGSDEELGDLLTDGTAVFPTERDSLRRTTSPPALKGAHQQLVAGFTSLLSAIEILIDAPPETARREAIRIAKGEHQVIRKLYAAANEIDRYIATH